MDGEGEKGQQSVVIIYSTDLKPSTREGRLKKQKPHRLIVLTAHQFLIHQTSNKYLLKTGNILSSVDTAKNKKKPLVL